MGHELLPAGRFRRRPWMRHFTYNISHICSCPGRRHVPMAIAAIHCTPGSGSDIKGPGAASLVRGPPGGRHHPRRAARGQGRILRGTRDRGGILQGRRARPARRPLHRLPREPLYLPPPIHPPSSSTPSHSGPQGTHPCSGPWTCSEDSTPSAAGSCSTRCRSTSSPPGGGDTSTTTPARSDAAAASICVSCGSCAGSYGRTSSPPLRRP